jgi:hypothetical protein
MRSVTMTSLDPGFDGLKKTSREARRHATIEPSTLIRG